MKSTIEELLLRVRVGYKGEELRTPKKVFKITFHHFFVVSMDICFFCSNLDPNDRH